uniref:Uncharacterized protein n=1 Tax=Anguilla anguilla TaxID=7936 RepID=A0A0E9X7N0_ANGAN
MSMFQNQPANNLPATLSTKNYHTSFWGSFQKLLSQSSKIQQWPGRSKYIYTYVYIL